MGAMRNAYKILIGIPEGRHHSEHSRHMRKCNINMSASGAVGDGGASICLTDKVQ